MVNTKHNRSTAVLFTLFFTTVSAQGAYAAQGPAYKELASGAGSVSVPAPQPPQAVIDLSQVSKTFVSRDSEKIMKMSDEALSAASPDQKLQMIKALLKDSNPNQNNNSDSQDPDQKNLERAIMRVLASAPDAASFDYVYYRLDQGKLERSVGWYKDVRDLVKKYRGTVVPGDWEGLRTYIHNVTKAVPAGRNLIKFLIDGKDFLPEATAALQSAQKSIHIEIFQLQADNIGQGIADILSAKAKAGLKVRLMIDEHGSAAEHTPALTTMLDSMRSSGVSIIVKKPLAALEGHLDHRKVVVIDGKTGFTGGMNIGRSYQVDWHDQQTLVVGPAVAKLQESFVERWTAAGGSFSAGEDLFPVIEQYPDGAETEVVPHVGWGDQNIKAMYLRVIGTAQNSIRIANPYFTDKDIINALCDAARRGVKVQLELPQDNNIPIVQHASRANYPKLAKAGVQIYEYKGRMAHEKVAVFDGLWATFGSSNLDERSLKNNDELNLVVFDFRLAQDIELRLFEADLPNCELMNNYSPSILDHLAHQVSGSI
ncbi:MAG: phosphatidylserine/phosphatidylglycerophosphate/cardiolipin synthase family protein [Elusimicrobia bacterium]|nr:phosphatidylserine/phosphatidylglycerophosphate/cardiolipin synthase family protein [Elusimicrobiota bacterium]